MENVEFTWQPVSQRVMLFADKTQLNRLFTNLMQNAIEAPDNQLDRTIDVNESLNGEYITINIRDNGGGIPALTKDKIFMPNFTTKSSGTGLGLAMSKSIAEQAKGLSGLKQLMVSEPLSMCVFHWYEQSISQVNFLAALLFARNAISSSREKLLRLLVFVSPPF